MDPPPVPGQNPYAASRAAVGDPDAPAEASHFDPEPSACDAGAGVRWLTGGWELFTRSPGLWIGFTVVVFVFLLGLSLVPILGMIAQYLLFPLVTAGIMVACDSLRRGEPITFGHFFEGFNRNPGQLVLIGLLYAVGLVALVVVALVPLLGIGGMALFSNDTGALQGLGATLVIAVLLVVALSVPLVMAVWFAPALVVFHGMSAPAAMVLSFKGCLRNIVPFLIYGLVGLVIAIAATLPLLLGWLVAYPVFAGSIYVGYREIWHRESA
jgi:uncharacterized membrane protein